MSDAEDIIVYDSLDRGTREQIHPTHGNTCGCVYCRPERFRADMRRLSLGGSVHDPVWTCDAPECKRCNPGTPPAAETVRRCGFPVLGAPCSRVVGHEGDCIPTILRERTALDYFRAQDFYDACALKWEDGRRKYGDTWRGDAPAVEAYAEQVDTYNYIAEHERLHGPSNFSARATDLCKELAMVLRLLAKGQP